MDPPWEVDNPERPPLGYVFRRFLRYGLLAWGGPVAQIGLMHREVVERDRWIPEPRFRKVLALYQALPGPEALELAVYFGMIKRGRWGGFLAGLGFMLPGVLIVAALAALYVAYAGTTTLAEQLLYGVRPAVVALIAVAFVRLSRASLPDLRLVLVAVASAFLAAVRPELGFIPVLLLGGLVYLALEWRPATTGAWWPLAPLALTWPEISSSRLADLAWLSAKVGLLTFGGAYTAIPFLQRGAVEDHAWLTNPEFLDGLALVGMVPAPLISIGVFVGFLAAGWIGAALATFLVFAPAFVITLAGHRFFERIVDEPRLHAFLLGVTAAVIGLLLVALIPLGFAAVFDGPTGVIAVVAVGLLMTGRVPIPVVVGASAVAGWALLRAA